MKTNTLGKTGFAVSEVCVGTSALGSFPAQYGYEVSTEVAVQTIERALHSPFTFIDTSNEYGGGDSERRIGAAIMQVGGVPEGTLVATKVDPVPGTDDFSGDRVRRSVAESLERLGLDHLPLVYLHDPEKISFKEANAAGGPVQALIQLRDEGVIGHLGVAGGPIDLELQYIRTDIFEVVISHNRWTLVDQTAAPLLEEATERNIAFVNAAPFGGGMLVRGPSAVRNYAYRPASAETISRVRRIEEICQEHRVPLAAVALQFSTRDERVASTIVGMSSPDRIEQTLALVDFDITEELWSQVEPLLIDPIRSRV